MKILKQDIAEAIAQKDKIELHLSGIQALQGNEAHTKACYEKVGSQMRLDSWLDDLNNLLRMKLREIDTNKEYTRAKRAAAHASDPRRFRSTLPLSSPVITSSPRVSVSTARSKPPIPVSELLLALDPGLEAERTSAPIRSDPPIPVSELLLALDPGLEAERTSTPI